MNRNRFALGSSMVLVWLALPIAAAADEPSTKSKSEARRPDKPTATSSRHASEPGQAEQTADADRVMRRVRELIYILRLHRVFERTDEWGGAIRELIEIGPAAVPELVRELETTDRDATLRALGFTLRGIGDPRAVPSLIRAIPKTLRPPGSDCGIVVADNDLFAFLKRFDRSPGDKKSIIYGRPVNEILDTLQTLTRHEEPPGVGQRDPLRHVFLGGSDAERLNQRSMFNSRQETWQSWWKDNYRQFVTQAQLDSVSVEPTRDDTVAKAGLEKFGPLFPTGDDVRLGEVREVELESNTFWDTKSHLDFDTGRTYEYLAADADSSESGERDFGRHVTGWFHKYGIDVRCQGALAGSDLYIWLIDDRRWDTLEAEVHSDELLALGREATQFLTPFGERPTDFQMDRGGTFLFTTREGGRGIVRTFPPEKQTTKCRLQFRMWLSPGAEAASVVPESAASPTFTPFAGPRKASLAAPDQSALYLFNLKTGQKYPLPDGATPETPGQRIVFETDKKLLPWCQREGIDLASNVSSGLIAFAGGTPPPPRKNLMRLVGFDLVARRVRPAAFDELGVEQVKVIVNRTPAKQGPISWMDPYPEDAAGPYTWAFRNRDGQVGLLQIDVLTKEPQSITFRYRISE